MIWRLRLALLFILIVGIGIVLSASCAALNEPNDVAVTIGFAGVLGTFVVTPWLATKILRLKGKVDAKDSLA